MKKEFSEIPKLVDMIRLLSMNSSEAFIFEDLQSSYNTHIYANFVSVEILLPVKIDEALLYIDHVAVKAPVRFLCMR